MCVCVCVYTYIYLIFYSSKPKDVCQNSIQAPFCTSQLLFLCGHTLLCLLGFRASDTLRYYVFSVLCVLLHFKYDILSEIFKDDDELISTASW